MARRSTTPPDYRCWWCKESTAMETGYRGYDPDDPIMAEFGGSVSAIICGPGCESQPTNGVIITTHRFTRVGVS